LKYKIQKTNKRKLIKNYSKYKVCLRILKLKRTPIFKNPNLKEYKMQAKGMTCSKIFLKEFYLKMIEIRKVKAN